MTASTTPKKPRTKPRAKPRKYPVNDFMGWKIRRLSPDRWQSDNMGKKPATKRERHFHDSLEAAKGYITDKQGEYNAQGAGADALTVAQREECLQAYRDISGRTTLADAVAFWTAHHPDGEAATLQETGAAWIAEQIKNKLRPGTIKLNRQRVDGLMRAMGDDTPCVTITTPALRAYLDGLKCAAVTRNGVRRCLRAFFQFCVDREILENNPVAKIKPIAEDDRLPDFMTDREVDAFMGKLAELHPESVPAFAIAFWAGLRPTEIHGQYGLEREAVTLAKKAVEGARETLKNAKKRGTKQTIGKAERSLKHAREALRAANVEQDRKRAMNGVIGGLQWQDVNLRDMSIRVRPETSKTRRARLVDISANLATWLMKYYRATGPVASPNCMRSHRVNVMKALKIKKWIPDWPRHTYATMHFAQFQNRDKLAAQMGHTGASGVLEKHYRGLATKEQAERFWAIAPKGAEAVQTIQLATKGA